MIEISNQVLNPKELEDVIYEKLVDIMNLVEMCGFSEPLSATVRPKTGFVNFFTLKDNGIAVLEKSGWEGDK